MKLQKQLVYGYQSQKDNVRYSKVNVQHITGEVETLFGSVLSYKNNTLLNDVIEGCVISFVDEFGNVCQESKKHIISQLMPGDINLILLAISDATHETTERELNPLCPKCKKHNLIKFDTATDLKYNKPNGVPERVFDVRLGNRVFTLQRITSGKIADISRQIPVETNGDEQYINPFKLRNEIIKNAVKSIKNADIEEKFEDLPGKVIAQLIEKYQNELSYGVDLVLDIKCFDCGHQWKQNLLDIELDDNKIGGLFHFFCISTPNRE